MSSLLASDREFALCQAEDTIPYDAGRAVWASRRVRRRATAVASSVQERGLDCRLGAGHGEERTQNIQRMSVTLDVSKLSGWLNADAPCRESKGGHAVRMEVCGSAGGGR